MYFTLNDLKELGAESFTEDFHCVTAWSKYDIEWYVVMTFEPSSGKYKLNCTGLVLHWIN